MIFLSKRKWRIKNLPRSDFALCMRAKSDLGRFVIGLILAEKKIPEVYVGLYPDDVVCKKGCPFAYHIEMCICAKVACTYVCDTKRNPEVQQFILFFASRDAHKLVPDSIYLLGLTKTFSAKGPWHRQLNQFSTQSACEPSIHWSCI
jgi:hypothetical protein